LGLWREVPLVQAKQNLEETSLFKELIGFAEVISIVKQDYVREVNNRQL